MKPSSWRTQQCRNVVGHAGHPVGHVAASGRSVIYLWCPGVRFPAGRTGGQDGAR